MSFAPILTDIGLERAIQLNGTQIKAAISHLGFGTQSYTPDKTQTRLKAEVVKKPILSGQKIGKHHAKVKSILEGVDDFEVGEIGIYIDDGATLFAVWSRPEKTFCEFDNAFPITFEYTVGLYALPPDAFTVNAVHSDFVDSIAHEIHAAKTMIGNQRHIIRNQHRYFQQYQELHHA